jgi:hypothetical protein
MKEELITVLKSKLKTLQAILVMITLIALAICCLGFALASCTGADRRAPAPVVTEGA